MAEAAQSKRARSKVERARRKQAEPAQENEPLASSAKSANDPAQDEDSERVLALLFARGVPLAGLGGSVIVGYTAGLAPALLVLAGTGLLGTIGFFWASLRTLSGDAPLPEGVSPHSLVSRTPAPERKRETLRALKDLELEHSVGKIDDADYLELSSRYRGVAKTLMREMDEGMAPRRKLAEEMVKTHLAKKKLTVKDKAKPEIEDGPSSEASAVQATDTPRLDCAKCSVSNEPDATFCKKCGTPLAEPRAAEEKPDASV